MVQNEELHILTIHFEPLYKGQNVWSQVVHYMEVSKCHYQPTPIGNGRWLATALISTIPSL